MQTNGNNEGLKVLSALSEKRIFSRIECWVDLEVQGQRRDQEFCDKVEALDLSLLGVGFERKDGGCEYDLGDTVTVAMQGLPAVDAKVRWNSGSRVGVQFCGRIQDILESWVGEVLAAQGVRVQDIFCHP